MIEIHQTCAEIHTVHSTTSVYRPSPAEKGDKPAHHFPLRVDRRDGGQADRGGGHAHVRDWRREPARTDGHLFWKEDVVYLLTMEKQES